MGYGVVNGMDFDEAEVDIVAGALDTLALALVSHGHKWTPRLRRHYELAMMNLGVHPDKRKRPMAKSSGSLKAPGNKKGGSTGVKKGKAPKKAPKKK